MQSGSLFPSRLLAYAQTHGQRFVAELKDFLRFPSVSAQPKHAGDVQQCAVWLADHLRQLGLERVQVIPTRRHPLVYAAWQHAPGRPTVLIYGHYDVQPADPLEAWHSPPFERPCVGTISTAAERATTRGKCLRTSKRWSRISAPLAGCLSTSSVSLRARRRAARAGIDRTVLASVFHSNYRVANRQVARLVASRPEHFYGFAMVHPTRDRGRVGVFVKEAVRCYGFCGIKVHRHDGRITREVCEVARTFALPILYDVIGEVAVVELLAMEYPEVAFIIPHLGSFADDWRAQLALIDHLVRHPNVYADTSGVRRFDLLQQAVRRAGARKMLFGSDGPWLHPGVELAKVHALGLPAADERLVLGGNLLRLLANGLVLESAHSLPRHGHRGTRPCQTESGQHTPGP